MKRCIGFGEFQGKCENEAGTKWSPHWCKRCNELRFDHIDAGFVKIQKQFDVQKRVIGEALEEVDNATG